MKFYVDGSYNSITKKIGYGIVIVTDKNNDIKNCFGEVTDAGMSTMRNVAGEITAAMKAVEYAKENKIDSIEIYYDYQGIENWVTGSWQAKNQYTQNYASFMRVAMKYMSITFYKVSAHTGDKYNELADELAKKATVESKPIEYPEKIQVLKTSDFEFEYQDKKYSFSEYELEYLKSKSVKELTKIKLLALAILG